MKITRLVSKCLPLIIVMIMGGATIAIAFLIVQSTIHDAPVAASRSFAPELAVSEAVLMNDDDGYAIHVAATLTNESTTRIMLNVGIEATFLLYIDRRDAHALTETGHLIPDRATQHVDWETGIAVLPPKTQVPLAIVFQDLRRGSPMSQLKGAQPDEYSCSLQWYWQARSAYSENLHLYEGTLSSQRIQLTFANNEDDAGSEGAAK